MKSEIAGKRRQARAGFLRRENFSSAHPVSRDPTRLPALRVAVRGGVHAVSSCPQAACDTCWKTGDILRAGFSRSLTAKVVPHIPKLLPIGRYSFGRAESAELIAQLQRQLLIQEWFICQPLRPRFDHPAECGHKV